MRQLSIFCAFFWLAGMAAGQTMVISGYASNWIVPPGVYAAPIAPLVTTPSVALGEPPLAVGASDATPGLAAGATNSTFSLELPAVSTVFAQPVWYGAATGIVAPEAAMSEIPRHAPQGFEFGATTFESSHGIAQAAARVRQHKHATRVYTNADIERIKP